MYELFKNRTTLTQQYKIALNGWAKTYRNIGRRIVDEEQNGNERAEYGSALLKELSNELTKEYGRGFSRSNLQSMRLLFLNYEKC